MTILTFLFIMNVFLFMMGCQPLFSLHLLGKGFYIRGDRSGILVGGLCKGSNKLFGKLHVVSLCTLFTDLPHRVVEGRFQALKPRKCEVKTKILNRGPMPI